MAFEQIKRSNHFQILPRGMKILRKEKSLVLSLRSFVHGSWNTGHSAYPTLECLPNLDLATSRLLLDYMRMYQRS